MSLQHFVAQKKVQVYNFSKLAVAVGALTAAIGAYTQVRRDQNNMLDAISDKIDALSVKVAYLEGRMSGLDPKAALKEAESKIGPAPVVPSMPAPPSRGEHVKKWDIAYRRMPRSFGALQMVVEDKADAAAATLKALEDKSALAPAAPNP